MSYYLLLRKENDVKLNAKHPCTNTPTKLKTIDSTILSKTKFVGQLTGSNISGSNNKAMSIAHYITNTEYNMH